jgi:hypothetical protein
MLLDFTDSADGFRRMWKCIGCGREILTDVREQTEDDRMMERIRQGTTAG